MPKLDLNKFNFTGEQITSVKGLVWELMLENPDSLAFVTLFSDIKVNKEVGFVGKGGLVGVAAQGCDPTPQDFSVSTRKITWQPKDWEVLLHQCYSDLIDTIAAFDLKSGLGKPDFTDTDYEEIVIVALRRAMEEFMWRFMWFNDTNIANVTEGGVLKDGVGTKYFNIIDGFWKQVMTKATSSAKQKLAIAENAKATYEEQLELDPAKVRETLYKMTFQAPLVLRAQPDKAIYVTQTVYDAYTMSLSDVEKATLESRESNFINGMPALTVNGVNVVAMPEWDNIIQSYFDNGTKFHYPHRALYTSKGLLGFGVDKVGDFEKFDQWYDRDSRKVKTEVMGNGDAKLLDDSLFVAAY